VQLLPILHIILTLMLECDAFSTLDDMSILCRGSSSKSRSVPVWGVGKGMQSRCAVQRQAVRPPCA
jgi:hypothetical protein